MDESRKSVCRCGMEQESDSRFCTRCGRPLVVRSPVTAKSKVGPRAFTDEEMQALAEALVDQFRAAIRWYQTESEGMKKLYEGLARIYLGDPTVRRIPDAIAAPLAFWFLETERFYIGKVLEKMTP